ncbi:helix-turn-helix domain-containing protein [Micromonospora sp. NPDC023633]|uniref:arsenate reductase/protein-tyrosine-phosphatase family protein n=1 Tax=Micromonospora sp. NPDC023633 TaxID=3154320 RepID=UPI0033D05C39
MATELAFLRRRARIHAALGDPARLATVDALTLGDAAPGEIAQDLGMPTNLVAHHVKVLAEAGLVVRGRSEGDRRRTYLRLRPEALATLTPAPLTGVGRVVFVCTRNPARSQLAAALWSERPHTAAASAGTKPAERVHPRAVAMAHRHGLGPGPDRHLPCRRHRARRRPGHRRLRQRPRGTRRAGPGRLHWSVPNPVRVDTDDAFEAAFADLARARCR